MALPDGKPEVRKGIKDKEGKYYMVCWSRWSVFFAHFFSRFRLSREKVDLFIYKPLSFFDSCVIIFAVI